MFSEFVFLTTLVGLSLVVEIIHHLRRISSLCVCVLNLLLRHKGEFDRKQIVLFESNSESSVPEKTKTKTKLVFEDFMQRLFVGTSINIQHAGTGANRSRLVFSVNLMLISAQLLHHLTVFCFLVGNYGVHPNTVVLRLHDYHGDKFLDANRNNRILCSVHLH